MSKQTMGKVILALLLIFFVSILVLGPTWYARKIGMPISEWKEGSTLNTLYSPDGKSKFGLLANYHFNKSGAKLFTSLDFERECKDLVHYMNANPLLILILTGNYHSIEDNATSYDNLGLARAISIKNHLSALGLNSNRIIAKGAINDRLEFYNDALVFKSVEFTFDDEVELTHHTTQQVIDIPDQFKYIRPLHIYYESDKIAVRLTPVLEKSIGEMAKYMEYHPSSKMILKGSSSKSVTLISERMEQLERLLLGMHIDLNRIEKDYANKNTYINKNVAPSQGDLKERIVITLKEF